MQSGASFDAPLVYYESNVNDSCVCLFLRYHLDILDDLFK